MTYRIEYLRTVVTDDIPALPKSAQRQIRRAIESKLTTHPFELGKPLRYSLRGARRLRLRIGQALHRLGDGIHELGFSTLGAYALERCNRGGRWAAETRTLARRLQSLPHLTEALEAGAIGWSMAELLARLHRKKLPNESFVEFLCTVFWQTWVPHLGISDRWEKIYRRDRYRCTNPVCHNRNVTLAPSATSKANTVAASKSSPQAITPPGSWAATPSSKSTAANEPSSTSPTFTPQPSAGVELPMRRRYSSIRSEIEMNYRIAYSFGFHPWEDAAVDPPFVAKITELFEREEEGRQPPYGSVLDIGTGSAIWGVELAKRGWQVTGIDIVDKALRRGRERASTAGVDMKFVQGDVTKLERAEVGAGFRLVLDSGTFHDFDEAQQRAMGRGIAAVSAPDATLLLLVWPKRRRPLIRGASREEIERAFPEWEITHVEQSHFRLPKPMQWLLRPDEHWYRLRRA